MPWTLKFSLALLLAAGIAHAAPAPSLEDVAIDPVAGDTFVLQTADNPQGDILVLNDRDESYSAHLEILDVAVPEARFELELNQGSDLAYLVQESGFWYLGHFVKGQRGWTRAEYSRGLTGQGEASGLTALPDGKLALTVERQGAGGKDAKVLVIDSSGARDRIVDRVDAARVEESAKALAQSASSMIQVADAESEPEYASGNGLGLAAGLQSGLGFAYRRHLANRWGVQVAGIAWGNTDSIFGDLGITAMRTLSKTEVLRFYALAGVSTYYSADHIQDLSACTPEGPCDPTGPMRWNGTASLNFGAGIGMEFTVAKKLGLVIELPLTLRLENATKFNGVYPVPNVAIIYYF